MPGQLHLMVCSCIHDRPLRFDAAEQLIAELEEMLEMAEDGQRCAELARGEAEEKAESVKALQESTEGWESQVNEEMEVARQATFAVRGACTAAQDKASEAAELLVSIERDVARVDAQQLQEFLQPESKMSVLVSQVQHFVADSAEGVAATAHSSCNIQQMCLTAPSHYENKTGQLLEVSQELDKQASKVSYKRCMLQCSMTSPNQAHDLVVSSAEQVSR